MNGFVMIVFFSILFVAAVSIRDLTDKVEQLEAGCRPEEQGK
ncbi:hypothetical protein [Allohahella sp. A8]